MKQPQFLIFYLQVERVYQGTVDKHTCASFNAAAISCRTTGSTARSCYTSTDRSWGNVSRLALGQRRDSSADFIRYTFVNMIIQPAYPYSGDTKANEGHHDARACGVLGWSALNDHIFKSVSGVGRSEFLTFFFRSKSKRWDFFLVFNISLLRFRLGELVRDLFNYCFFPVLHGVISIVYYLMCKILRLGLNCIQSYTFITQKHLP